MSAERETDSDELTVQSSAPVAGLRQQRIRRRPPSKRSAVNEFQARALALMIDTLERAALRHFEAPSPERLPLDRHEEFSALPNIGCSSKEPMRVDPCAPTSRRAGPRSNAASASSSRWARGLFSSCGTTSTRFCVRSAGSTAIPALSFSGWRAARCMRSPSGWSMTRPCMKIFEGLDDRHAN
jgi:hypothetical protein